MMADARAAIKSFIVRQVMFEGEDSHLKFDDSLLEGGILDSIGIVRLVTFLEKKFDISIRDENILPENFDTVESISRLVAKLQHDRVARPQTA